MDHASTKGCHGRGTLRVVLALGAASESSETVGNKMVRGETQKQLDVILLASENRPWERVSLERLVITHWLIELLVFNVQLCEFIVT